MKIILIFLCLNSCAAITKATGKKEQPASTIDSAVKQKAELYISLQKPWQQGCDGVGFEALCKLSGGCKDSNVFDAEGEPGRWYRTPQKDCYDTGESKSDISKDMFTMLFPYLYATGDQNALRRIHAYGRSNRWVMGRGPLSRTLMTPPMAMFLGEMLGVLTTNLPTDTPQETIQGFEKHLDAISWMTQAMVRGYMQATDYETLRKYANDSPRNALFQALRSKYQDGDQTKAIAILKDESIFPSDRLPESKDRCTPYLWEREEKPTDWGPCDAGNKHNGTDYILAAWVAGQI